MIEHSTLWNWGSPVWLVVVALLAAYVVVFRSPNWRKLGVLVFGLVMLASAFVSPIGVLANGYLFSAHVVQHLLLLLVIPLCLLLCWPSRFSTVWLDRTGHGSIPIACWVAGVGAMWFWHVPTMCNAATESGSLGTLRDVSFLIAGLAFWWPIYSPVHRVRLPPLSGIAYLFSACLGCTLLGIYLTFTTVSVCPAFANPVDRIGIMTLLYDAGFTPGIDQHVGGLLMWVPPCSLYVGAIIGLLGRWYSPKPSVVDPQGLGQASRLVKAGQEERLAT